MNLLAVSIILAAAAGSLGAPQRPPYQPGPWVYPKPTSEPPLPLASSTRRPATVSNVTPPRLGTSQRPKPVAASFTNQAGSTKTTTAASSSSSITQATTPAAAAAPEAVQVSQEMPEHSTNHAVEEFIIAETFVTVAPVAPAELAQRVKVVKNRVSVAIQHEKPTIFSD